MFRPLFPVRWLFSRIIDAGCILFGSPVWWTWLCERIPEGCTDHADIPPPKSTWPVPITLEQAEVDSWDYWPLPRDPFHDFE